MRQFVPMSDDLLDRLDSLPGPLVPYQCGVPCWHQLQIEEPAREDLGEPARFELPESEAVSA